MSSNTLVRCSLPFSDLDVLHAAIRLDHHRRNILKDRVHVVRAAAVYALKKSALSKASIVVYEVQNGAMTCSIAMEAWLGGEMAVLPRICPDPRGMCRNDYWRMWLGHRGHSPRLASRIKLLDITSPSRWTASRTGTSEEAGTRSMEMAGWVLEPVPIGVSNYCSIHLSFWLDPVRMQHARSQ